MTMPGELLSCETMPEIFLAKSPLIINPKSLSRSCFVVPIKNYLLKL